MNNLAVRVTFVIVAVLLAGGNVFAICPGPTEGGQPISPVGPGFNPPSPVTYVWSTPTAANDMGFDVWAKPVSSGTWVHQCSAATGATSCVGSPLSPNGQWEWVVKTQYSACGLGYSASPSAYFQVGYCPSTPLLASPGEDQTDVPVNVTFSWSNAIADEYDIYLGEENSGVCSFDPLPPAATSLGTSWTPPTLDSGKTYEWRVVAKKDGCEQASSCRKFTTVGAAETCPTDKAALTSPALLAHFEPQENITFTWTAVTGAIGYEVIVASDGQVIRNIGAAGTSATDFFPRGNYAWTVKTNFGGGCDPTFAEGSAFIVGEEEPACPTDAPRLLAPANGAQKVASPVTFRWSAVQDAVGYRLLATDGSGFTLEVPVAGDVTEVTRAVPAGTIRWAVDAIYRNCPFVRSSFASFIATVRECPRGPLTLNTPVDGATTGSPVTFIWSAVNGAEAYRLWIASGTGAPTLAARTTATTATINLPSGSGKWFVEALTGDDCPSIVSERRTLTVQQAANCGQNPAPALVGPSGTVSNPITFQWTGVANARGYRLWLSHDGQPFEDLVVTQQTSLQRALQQGRYTFYVEAIFDGCPPVASARLDFVIAGNENACTEEKPSLLTPAANASATSPVTFTWTAVARAISYRVFAQHNNGEPQLIGVTEDTSLTRVLPPGTFVWLVQAVFERCQSTESNRSTFIVPRAQNCSATPPQLVAPGNNVSGLASEVTFTWNAVAGAVRYELLLRRNNGPEISAGETTETTLERKLPAGLYEWTVVASFGNCDPVRSAAFVFAVTEPENCDNRRPLLLTPPSGSRITSPVEFAWTAVPRATGYKLWLEIDGATPAVLTTTTETRYRGEVPGGRMRWWVVATFANCPEVESNDSDFEVVIAVACTIPEEPRAFVIAQAVSRSSYTVRWTPVPNAEIYELQESSTADFSGATTEILTGNVAPFSHDVAAAELRYYRVRAISSCNDERGPYSDVVKILIVPRNATRGVTAELGTEGDVVQTIQLPGTNPPVTFVATVDKPGFTVTPSSGTLGPDGVTLTVTASREALRLGSNTANVRLTYGSAGRISTNDAPATVPVTVSLVTPVTPSGKNTPPPDALIIPAVAHAAGANNSQFESDIRITNLGAQSRRYQLNFTPSNQDGRSAGSTTTIEIEPGDTVALDDVLANVFGITSGTGALEIRPLGTPNTSTTTTALTTIASSRTYNVTPNGTFGQWIPAIAYAQFIGRSPGATQALLSLQQIAQSANYRSNFGFVEGSGVEASLLARFFNAAGVQVGQATQVVPPFGHVQLPLLAANGITLDDGRVEVEVTSAGGRVTAYASLVDNKTNDPLLVTPVVAGGTIANRYALPGMAYINNGFANWQSDVRLFNSNTTATPATLTYYPQQNPAGAIVREVTLNGGQLLAFDNILNTLYGITDPLAGGQIVVSTPADSSIVATARTYNQTTNGTYGQFIPGVTPAESVGRSDRALQVLQLEQSSRFRSNIGVAETTGNAATVEVSVTVPGSRVAPVVTLNLKANEFYQFSLASFGLGDGVYNARATVKVTSGNGKVTAYGSVIDMTTQDPTYVPAQ
ncbi:MAG TPA: hypothetical protein VF618_09690 [Thermoanaerobaculia bacterium]